MRKVVIITFDILILLGLILVTPFFILNSFNTVSETLGSGGSISNEAIVLLQVFFAVITIIILLVLIKLINQNKIITPSKIIKHYFKKHKIKSIVYMIIVLFLSVATILLVNQRKIIYLPNYSFYSNKKLTDENDYKQVIIDDYVGWLKNDLEERPIIIYYAGNGESSAKVFVNFMENEFRIFSEYNFIMIDYPEYGLSGSKLSEHKIKEMALLTYNYVLNELEYEENKIIVMGYSLGTGVATYVASKKAISKLILVAPYSSLVDVSNTILPVFYGPLKNLIIDKFESYKIAKNVDAETLIIASKKDEVIKYKLSKKLSTYFNDVTFKEISHLRHGNFFSEKLVDETIIDFLT